MTTKGYPTVTHKTPKIWPSVIALILLLAAPAQAQNYTLTPDPFLTVLDNSGLIVVGGCVWTYAAGTTTPIATYSNNSGTTNTNPIIADTAGRYTAYLLAGTNYKFVYETACTPPAHGSVLRTADNIAGVPASAANVDITCTAGETISAGQAVYLSAGSGGKTVGQCYKGDSTNAYSSSAATVVGIAPSAITSASSGTVRLAGSVTGLSSLSPGSDYYISTAGAITSTAPTNARKLGAADTSTSLILTLPIPLPNADNATDGFRVGASSATCFPTADITAATTLYLTPCTGNRIALYDSSGVATVYVSAEVSIAVPATTSQMYDIFVFASGSTPTLELLAWTNDTTRATGITRTTTGAYTKSGDLTRRYVGSFRTTTVSGQTEDSFAKRYVWNYYNRIRRVGRVFDSTDSWPYTTATWRQMNGAATNQLDFVIGVAEVAAHVQVTAQASNTNVSVRINVGIGEDSTTTPSATSIIGLVDSAVANARFQLLATDDTYPAIGRHVFVPLEFSAATGTTTWYGDNGGGPSMQTGILGWIEG